MTAPNALTRLERSLSELTVDDLLDDPHLDALLERLASGDAREHRLLQHARAVLVLGARVPPQRAAPVADGLQALGALMTSPHPPEAFLRVRTSPAKATFDRSQTDRPEVEIPWFVALRTPSFGSLGTESLLVASVPPVADVICDRRQPLWCFRGGRTKSIGRRWDEEDEPAALIDPRADSEQWLQDATGSRFISGQPADEDRRWWDRHRCLPDLPGGAESWLDLKVPAETWYEADTHLGLIWLPVRDAVRRGHHVRLPDGTVLLPVADGIAVRLRVRRHGDAGAPVRAAVACSCMWQRASVETEPKLVFREFLARVETHEARTGGYTTRLAVLLPTIRLTGGGMVADIDFVSAPLLKQDMTITSALTTVIAGAVAAVDSAERRREREEAEENDDDERERRRRHL